MIFIVVVKDKTVSEKIPVVDFIQFFSFPAWQCELYPINRHRNTVRHILYLKVDVLAALHRRIRQLHRRNLFIYHMYRKKAALFAGSNSQLVTAIWEKVDLSQRNGNLRYSRIAVGRLFVQSPFQFPVQRLIVFSICHQIHIGNTVHPCLFRLGSFGVIKHDDSLSADMISVIRFFIRD